MVPDFTDVALVSLGTTAGLRRADEAFAQQLRHAGLACEVVPVRVGAAGALRRHPAITDLVESLAARRAPPRPSARVVVFSTVTAAFLRRDAGPYAVRFDSPAALNRPGAAGAWQRRAERRALAGARCLLPWSEGAANAAPGDAPRVVLPVPIEHLPHADTREIDVLAYAGDPKKRGLDVLCRAWSQAGGGARLVVGGIEPDRARRWLARREVPEPDGIEWMGPAPRERWLDTLRRARLFVNASRWEDYGLSQLEALAGGAALVTVPSAGPYEALPLARRLEPRLVADDLAHALAAGLALSDSELERYRGAAANELAPYRPAAVQELVSERVVPALGLA